MLRSDRHAETPTFPGLHAGKVEQVDGQGRVKATVPSVFDKDAPEMSVWARPCFPYGHFFVPEPGDLVWIAFEGGDPQAPVWLGSWYPQGSVPSEAQADPPRKRVIRSSSGHLIVLDDTHGKERLVLADATGSRIELSGNGVTITCAGDLTIDATGKTVSILAKLVKIEKKG
jgi:uncharacterized protein involved in type VI secretion and phage assembly